MYRPTQRMQIGDPTTTLDSYICTMESGAMALDFHTLGKIKVWGGNLVQHCGRSVSTIIGHGTNLDNVKTAWAYYGQTLTIKSGHTFNDMVADLRAGRGVILQGDYDQFSLATRCQDNFLGVHAIYLNPEFSGSSILMQDPLCSAPKFVASGELRNFAEKLGRTVDGISSPQKILYAVTAAHPSAATPPPVVVPPTPKPVPTPVPAPKPVPTSVKYTLHIAAGAKVQTANLNSAGLIVSWNVRTWGSTGSSAPCLAPTTIRGAVRGSAPVAKVTAGVFAGKYVLVGGGVSVSHT